MQLPYLQLVYPNDDFRAFVAFWRQFYVPNEKTLPLYLANIDKKRFRKSDIGELYKWKNSMDYSKHPKKSMTVALIQRELRLVNQLKRQFERQLFEDTFGGIGAIWQIFLLHIIQPDAFPIFDQHVYRTHLFLEHRTVMDIPAYGKTKLDYYHSVYCPFFNNARRRYRLDRFQLDNALWMFGRFLLTKEGKAATAALPNTSRK
jgi:hypothetical protein